MNALPGGWTHCEIGEVAEVVGGGTPASKDPSNFTTEGGIPWITPADLSGHSGLYISRGARNLTEKGFNACSASKVPPGSVLFSSRAPIGYVAIAANELSTSQGFKTFVLAEGLDSRFVYFYLRYITPVAEDVATGTTFKELSGSKARKLPLLIAPTNEQRRIAEKLSRLIMQLDKIQERLDRVRYIMEGFRDVILDAATSGRLTEDWRKVPGRPKSAREVTLHEVVTDLRYGSAAKSSHSGTVPVLRMGNIQDGKLDWRDLVYTSNPVEIERYSLLPGDVLFNRTNSPQLVGKTAVYKGERPAIYAGYLIKMRCGEELLPDYLSYCLNSPAGREYCRRVKSDGINQSNISAKKLAEFSFVLRPLEEQQEIVRRVEAHVTYADRVRLASDAARDLAAKLVPALLDKAFRGKLVHKDVDDEAVHELLERMRAERAATPKRRQKITQGKSGRTRMTEEAVRSAIREIPDDMFTFDDLRKSLSGDYEQLRDILFTLLTEANPLISQVFDRASHQICFVRSKR